MITASVVLGKFAIPLDVLQKPWLVYAIILGVVFVLTFNFFALTVQNLGIALATIFQKMTMIVPAFIALVYYGDSITILKLGGIFLAISAIFLVQMPFKKSVNQEMSRWWYLAMLTFVGSAIIDGLLYYLEVEGISQNADIGFVASLFLVAGIAGLLMLLLKYIKTGKFRMTSKDFTAGVLLGVPNFFSIYLLLYLLAQGWEGSKVFPINNVGILTVATLIGIVGFKEKINTYRVVGFAAAIISIILISNG